MTKPEYCDSIRRGCLCPDDMCRGVDTTLCGYDVWDEDHQSDEAGECHHGVPFCDECEWCEEEEDEELTA